jgi:hypothetical protein
LAGAPVPAEIGDDRTRFADARGLKAFAGSAPISRARGKKTVVLHRHINSRRLAAIGPIWALGSLPSPGARRHYDTRRAAGDWNHQAQPHRFNKFVGHLHHCLQTNQLYNEHQALSRGTEVDESEILAESRHFLSRCSHAGFGFIAPRVLNRQCSNVWHPDEMEPELDIA